jgi:hypothetical protein
MVCAVQSPRPLLLALLLSCGGEPPTAQDAEDAADDAQTAAEKTGDEIGETASDVGLEISDTVHGVVDSRPADAGTPDPGPADAGPRR